MADPPLPDPMTATWDTALPLPGRGATGQRLMWLYEQARRHPLASARLLEAHTDAVAILAEAGREAAPGDRYGVWASRGDICYDADAGVISGTKPFCSGIRTVTKALVTVTTPRGEGLLLDLPIGRWVSMRLEAGVWETVALADSDTGRLVVDRHPVQPDAVVGGPGWYLSRPGFWHGACAPASCWAGGAAGLVDAAEAVGGTDPHRLAHLGRLRALDWGNRAALAEAGRQIDADPTDVVHAQHTARAVRHLVERNSTAIADTFGQALGPRPFVGDVAVAQRMADLHLYLRQDHSLHDLAALGGLPRSPGQPPSGHSARSSARPSGTGDFTT